MSETRQSKKRKMDTLDRVFKHIDELRRRKPLSQQFKTDQEGRIIIPFPIPEHMIATPRLRWGRLVRRRNNANKQEKPKPRKGEHHA